MSILLRSLLATFTKSGKIKPISTTKVKPEVKTKKEPISSQLAKEAQSTAKEIIAFAREEADKIRLAAQTEMRELQSSLRTQEDKLHKLEDSLQTKDAEINKHLATIEATKIEIGEIRTKQVEKLEKIGSLSKDKAKEILLAAVDKKLAREVAERIRSAEEEVRETADTKARDLLIDAMYHGSTEYVAEFTISTVKIPDDDVKGRIIGKEGRNIKTLEKLTGVEVIVDDTPGLITISSYDSVRRQVARVALENLIADGRIQPAKIEEMVDKAKQEINKIIKEKGEAAAYECGVFNLDPRIVSILGRLHFRTSYGQNVLQHSIEMSHIAGMLATEIGANINVAKAGALLHDIGKAVDHEISGTHVDIGRRILQKFGADEKIIRAMESHHGEYPYSTLESYIVQAADAISGARPGARRDSVENYLKRLGDLEAIATAVSGVEKAYALQAGRELRVFVTPSQVNDVEAKEMARDIAVRIENELKYPGEIRVVVIRESRTIEFAR